MNNPKGIGRDVTGIGHHGTENYELQLAEINKLNYTIGLISQSYLLKEYFLFQDEKQNHTIFFCQFQS